MNGSERVRKSADPWWVNVFVCFLVSVVLFFAYFKRERGERAIFLERKRRRKKEGFWALPLEDIFRQIF